ncbi:TetR/AcrR family transcriptional regulator [Roseovarius indicus]|uniref:TetR/AcrR family transcriptional regulator n=1 Tax=Roseovarius indicus TaxID=540747 RepID=UPI0007DA2FA3|nr:TetR/AcrR family transcriptional regulator [Roseovarius indicus]OAO05674.1 TetR family transcriptional regulator [Roseovarius indicus]
MSSEKNPTRTRILKAAWELLESNPGVAARMSDIAKKAGVSRQALYLHFPNRTELFVATTKYMDEVYCVQDSLADSRAATTGEARLEAYITAWSAYVPKIFGIAKTLIVMSETDEDAARAWAERMQDMREGCEAAVAALARDSALTSDYSETEATDLLWTLMSLQTWESLVVKCGWDQARYKATVLSLARKALVEGAD